MRLTRNATDGASSSTGSVFAIAQTVVKPPAAAARVPVAMVSLYSKPGSRRCAWRSTKPGATTRPAASTTSAPFAAILSSTFATTPSRRRTSSVWSRLRDGSTTRPPLRSTASLIAARSDQEIEDGHAHRDAVLDLVEDDRVRPVRDGGVDLDAAVHRARVHHDRVLFREALPFGCQAELLEVLLVRREAEAASALLLDPQNHHDVGPFDGFLEARHDARAPALDLDGEERRRTEERDARAHLRQKGHVRARDAAVRDVAADRDPQAGERALRAADRECVEQGLCRVRVRAVARVHDRAGEVPRQKVRGSRARMADDDRVRSHRHEVSPRVEERLALRDRRPRGRERDRVGGKTALGDLE